MSMIIFFFLLTLLPHGYGQPTGINQAPWIWGKASEAAEPMVGRIRRNSHEIDDDDDYEGYETPTPELMGENNFTTQSLAVTEGTSAPGTTDLVNREPMTHETTVGKQVLERLTTEAVDMSTMNAPSAEEPTSALPIMGLQTTHDVTTENVVTDVSEIVVPTTEESTSNAPSPEEQGSHDFTTRNEYTDTMAISTMGKSVTDPLTTVTLALDTDKPQTVAPTMTLPDTTTEPPPILPAELHTNLSSPTSSLNDSDFFSITVHPIHNLSNSFSSHDHSDPPRTKIATSRIELFNTTTLVAMPTTVQPLFPDHIPVRQCLLAILILALIATIFLICTVVLAMRLSKKGHTYPVRDYSPTEMVCISSLLAEGEGPPTANGSSSSGKAQLLKPALGPGEDCDGDNLTLHSFLP